MCVCVCKTKIWKFEMWETKSKNKEHEKKSAISKMRFLHQLNPYRGATSVHPTTKYAVFCSKKKTKNKKQRIKNWCKKKKQTNNHVRWSTDMMFKCDCLLEHWNGCQSDAALLATTQFANLNATNTPKQMSTNNSKKWREKKNLRPSKPSCHANPLNRELFATPLLWHSEIVSQAPAQHYDFF